MPAHEVKFTVPKRPLAHKDIQFEVLRDGQKFGELRISQGNVVWIPAHGSYGHALSWQKIDELSREFGTRRKVKY